MIFTFSCPVSFTAHGGGIAEIWGQEILQTLHFTCHSGLILKCENVSGIFPSIKCIWQITADKIVHIHGYNIKAFICDNEAEEIGELLLLFKCMFKFTSETLGL